jgi:hypothetical protein
MGIHMNDSGRYNRRDDAYVEEKVRQRDERDLKRSELEREVQGDAVTEKRRSPFVIVAWIVAAALAMLAVLVLMGIVHL